MNRLTLAAVLAATCGTGPWEVAAQTRPPIYEREVFTYPAFDRRDPFQPLHLDTRAGPRFDDLALVGVLYTPQLGSVAILIDRTTGRRYRARERDNIGAARVLQIRTEEVDFVITSFGVSRRETLRVRRERGTGA
ncbi:MAG: pilus assembly protein PilP [Gemmatimonadales bacterium]|nr:pilus assembly protein PilP [Candidatus Palauibacter irciniicola]MYC18822.1 pilus assembly protein PilP [Gemmatimonadales bacterium]